MSVVIDYSTWERDDSCGMFDHSQEGPISAARLHIAQSCLVLRSRVDYGLRVGAVDAPILSEEQELILTILKHKRLFQIKAGSMAPQPLCRIVGEQGVEIKVGSRFRLGKVELWVAQCEWGERSAHYYRSARRPRVNGVVDTFTASFYAGNEGQSLLESNPTCRYCFGKSVTANNPLVTRCECTGTAKYTHAQCLVQWVRKRSQQLVAPRKGIYIMDSKALNCEVCHTPYRLHGLHAALFGAPSEPFQDYFLLHAGTPQNTSCLVLPLKASTLTIGRSAECDFMINELSVSRRHCRIELDRTSLKLTLFDEHAKFGTVLLTEQANVNENIQAYQKGRTKIAIRTLQTKSFLERIGICSPQETFFNQGRR